MMPEKPSFQDGSSLGHVQIDRETLDALVRVGVINGHQRRNALDWLHPAHLWAHWSSVLFGAFGTALILSGIIFFFAFNWAAIPDLLKLGTIQVAVVIAAIAAWYLTLERLSGQLSLLVAAVLVGVFLATFGQIYQTGADPWQLFALWALLITPWTLVSHLAAFGAIWLILVNLALSLWWHETLMPRDSYLSLLHFAHIALNGSALMAREWLLGRPTPSTTASQLKPVWLKPLWTRWSLIVAMLFFLFPAILDWVKDPLGVSTIEAICGLLGLVLLAALIFVYRKLLPDIPALAMLLLVACLLTVITLAIRLDDWGMSELGTTFITAIVAIAVFALAAGYLRKLLERSGQAPGGQQ